MAEPKSPTKPPPGFSAFKTLLGKLAKVPKSEIDQKEAEYREERQRGTRTRAAPRRKTV
jgi:hypothetical protein